MPKTLNGSGLSTHEVKQINKVTLSKTIRCTGCGDRKSHSGFSSHKLFILRQQIYTDIALEDRDIRCQICAPGQPQLLMCSFCDEDKGLSRFSRVQRKYGDKARCKSCVKVHQGPPPGCEKEYPYTDDEYDDEDGDDYAVRQLIRPHDDGCHLPGPPATEVGEDELSSAFQNLTTEPHQGVLDEQAEQGSSRGTSSSHAQHGSSCSDSEPSSQRGHSWSGSENLAPPAPLGYHWNGPEYPGPLVRQVSRSPQSSSLSGSAYPTSSPQQGPSRSGSGFPSSRPQQSPSRSGSGFPSSRPQQGPSWGGSGFQNLSPLQDSFRSGSESASPLPQQGHSRSSSGFQSLNPDQRPSRRRSRSSSSHIQPGPSWSGSGQPSSSKAEGEMVIPIGEETEDGWKIVVKKGGRKRC